MNLKSFAKKFLEVGVNVLPTKVNEKYPKVKSWKRYQAQFISDKEIENLFSNEIDGIGVVCGKISGNLECIDFDNKLGNVDLIFDEWKDNEEISDIVQFKCLIEKTQSGGFHVFYRSEKIEGNLKLAYKIKADGKPECIIETRGEGGFAVVYPSKNYHLINGSWTHLPELCEEERELLLNHCRAFNEHHFQKKFSDETLKESRYEEKPGDAYNNSTDGINEAKILLAGAGWILKYERNGIEYWTRPGAKTKGTDATFRNGFFYVFSTNAHPFESEHGYSPFSILIIIKFNGDVKEAVKYLVGKRFGKLKVKEERPNRTDESEQFYQVKFSRKIPKLIINKNNFIYFLKQHGLGKLYIGKNIIFVRVTDNVVEEVSIPQIRDYVICYVDQLKEPIVGDFHRIDLKLCLLESVKDWSANAFLETLPTLNINFKRDNRDEAYFFFRNGWIRVNESGKTVLDYSRLDGCIWKKQIIDRDFEEVNFQDCDFKIFVKNICRGEEDRYRSLISAIGYLLHTYKDPNNSKAIIFCDEGDKYSTVDESSGRSGKSLLGKAIGKLRNEIRIDARNFKFDKSFAFQSINLDTQLIHFNDVHKRFDFEKLFSIITDAITVEKKTRDEFIIPFETSPKILISTNYTIQVDGESGKDRKFEIEFSNYYNRHHRPVDDFEFYFFDEWNEYKWKQFDNFMIDCAYQYFQEGLVGYEFRNLIRKQIAQGTSTEFYEYMFQHLELGKKFYVGEHYKNFIEMNPHLKEDVSDKNFGRWIRKYGQTNDYLCKNGRDGPDRFWILEDKNLKESEKNLL